MKKICALVVVLFAVMISSTASAATMPDWKLVKEETAIASPNPKYNLTPYQYYQQQYNDLRKLGYSVSIAKEAAGNLAREYQAEREAELSKNIYSQPQKKSSFYIDLNSIAAEQSNGGVAFQVVVKQVYTPFGRNIYINSFRKIGAAVPAGIEKLSFVVAKVHFKSTNGITKYFTISDRVAFTTDGNPINSTVLSNAPPDWVFIKPEETFDTIFDVAYSYL